MKILEKNINKICQEAKSASLSLSNSTNKERNIALKLIAENIIKFKKKIIRANKKDFNLAK